MTTVAVIGLGTMGLGIVQVFALAGCTVLATDANPHSRDSALTRLQGLWQARVSAGKWTAAQMETALSRIRISDDLSTATLAIEAIIEDRAAKSALIAGLEAMLPPDAVIATNTSSLSVTSLAALMRRPERFLGLHFFNPAPAMKLVELIPHAGTDPLALTTARQIAQAAGKTVVDCADSPGFIVNRCARPFYGEALAMLAEGIPAARIDAAMLAAGYRLGPFALIDLIGADINLAATESLSAAMNHHPRYHVFAALRAQVAAGHLGQKSGKGFITPATVTPTADPQIVRRIEATLVNEAHWLLSEGGTTPDGIDTALRLGLNFPRGPFQILAQDGAAPLRAALAVLAAAAPPSLAGRYDPAPTLP